MQGLALRKDERVKALVLVATTGSNRQAALKMGVNPRTIDRLVHRAKTDPELAALAEHAKEELGQHSLNLAGLALERMIAILQTKDPPLRDLTYALKVLGEMAVKLLPDEVTLAERERKKSSAERQARIDELLAKRDGASPMAGNPPAVEGVSESESAA